MRDLGLIGDRIGNRCRCADIDTAECEPIETELPDDGLEVENAGSKSDIGDLSIRIAHPPHVIANHSPPQLHEAIGDLLHVRPSEPVTRQVTEDVRREDQRWPVAEACIGDADAIERRRVLHWHWDGRHSSDSMAHALSYFPQAKSNRIESRPMKRQRYWCWRLESRGERRLRRTSWVKERLRGIRTAADLVNALKTQALPTDPAYRLVSDREE